MDTPENINENNPTLEKLCDEQTCVSNLDNDCTDLGDVKSSDLTGNSANNNCPVNNLFSIVNELSAKNYFGGEQMTNISGANVSANDTIRSENSNSSISWQYKSAEETLNSETIVNGVSQQNGVNKDLPHNERKSSSESCSLQVDSNSEIVDPEEDLENASNLSTGDYSGSGEESDSEDPENSTISDIYPTTHNWQFRVDNPKLPDTVTVLESPNGGRVYVVGTAHFSLDSQEDVAKTIRATQPDIVLVELCKSRVNILSLDEETILEESKNMNMQKIRSAIRQNGFTQGIMYLLLLSMSAHLTKQLGMAPGGEFRRAFTEAKNIPGCLVHLGDRPIHITLRRALSSLSLWQKLRLGWYMLTSKEPISKEEVERCKQRDLLEEMLAEMTGEFPALSKVFVQERDIYLTYSLQMASAPMPLTSTINSTMPTVVVGVVGIGHVPGIVSNWGKVSEKDIPPILSIPKATFASKMIRHTVRLSIVGATVYGCYRLLPSSLTSAIINKCKIPIGVAIQKIRS